MTTWKVSGVFVNMCFCGLLMSGTAIVEAAEVREEVRRVTSGQRMILQHLGLSEDVTDDEIVKLLEDEKKLIFASSLVSYRRLSSAIPKLSEIVENDEISVLCRMAAATTLCDLGNMDWVETIRGFLEDPDLSPSGISYKIRMAGLLARSGDFSYFDIVGSNVGDEKSFVRHAAVRALGNFRLKENVIADQAVVLLETAATGDPDISVRMAAIRSLEKIAKEKPDIIPKVVKTLEANLYSPERFLRMTCKVGIERYWQKSMSDDEVIGLLDDKETFVTGASLVQQRKLQSAVPKLLQVLRHPETGLYRKYVAGRTLMKMGNTEWITPIKDASNDPSVYRSVSQRLWLIGLLTRGGDYSQFEVVAGYLRSGKLRVRHEAIRALGDFGLGAGQVAVRALELLEGLAVGDPDTKLRGGAIASIERIVSEKPDALAVLIRVLKANVNSENAYLRKQCETMLKKHQKPPNQQ